MRATWNVKCSEISIVFLFCFYLCPVRTKFKIPKYSRGIPSSLEFLRTYSASTVDLWVITGRYFPGKTIDVKFWVHYNCKSADCGAHQMPVCRPGGEWGGSKENLKPSHIIFPRDQLMMDSSSLASWVKQSWKKQDEAGIFIHAFSGSFFPRGGHPCKSLNKINMEEK